VNLPSCSRAVAMLFPALSLAILSLYDFLLSLYIMGKLCTQSINFSSNSSLQIMVYKNTTAVNKQQPFLPVSQDFYVMMQKSRIRCCSCMTQPHPRIVTVGHSWARPLKTSPLQNHSFDFCVPHHVYTSITAWLLKTKALYSQYIFSLSMFVIKNKDLFSTNCQIHNVHTRFKTNLHSPIANLTKFQKGVYYSGIKIFNNLPHNIKDLANEIKLFQNVLKRFLLINSFYNSEEYFNYQR
jgi:hypothetical protein